MRYYILGLDKWHIGKRSSGNIGFKEKICLLTHRTKGEGARLE